MSENKTVNRYRVQFYTERPNGELLWCVCDFADEAVTGFSPIVVDELGRYLLFATKGNARTFAQKLNTESKAATQPLRKK